MQLSGCKTQRLLLAACQAIGFFHEIYANDEKQTEQQLNAMRSEVPEQF